MRWVVTGQGQEEGLWGTVVDPRADDVEASRLSQFGRRYAYDWCPFLYVYCSRV